MSTPALTAALDRMHPRGRGDTAARDRRDHALAAFEAHGYPTRRLEEWRYTDLRPIERGGFDFAPPALAPEAVESAAEALAGLPYGPGASVAVFVDGSFCSGLSRLPAALAAQLNVASRARPQSPYAAPSPRHALAALNEAFATTRTLLIEPGHAGGDALAIVFVAATPGIAAQIRLELDVQPAAHASVVLHFVSAAADQPGWTNVVMDIGQAESSRLDITRIQALSAEQSLTMLVRPLLGADAQLRFGTFDVGGALIRTDFETTLAAAGAGVDVYGLSTAASGGHVDNHICADHRAADTRSTQTFRSIVDDGGRVVFNGKVIVRPDAQHTDARQSSDNLLLARNAEVDTKPELEIYADDVRCSHGATVGELDSNELFYLQSRGISEDAARRLLTYGFANRLLLCVDDEPVRQWLARRVLGTLTDMPDLPDSDIPPDGAPQ